jgi:prepilin-type N-terminal cleavage/methylation domain-containing protein
MFKNFFNKKIQKETEKGFTLIEMLVSLALFSIVIVVIMGSILTIVDVNRKSQSLTVVMNDLNFVLESITRTVKTGEIQTGHGSRSEIEIIDQEGRVITYRFENGAIERKTEEGGEESDYISLTSEQIEITAASFDVFDDEYNFQPRILIFLDGEVAITERIRSAFRIQTTVSQRNLDDDHL